MVLKIWNVVCQFCYGPAGHVVTGDLRMIKDAKLKELVNKGPSYNEQNNIDWCLNAKKL